MTSLEQFLNYLYKYYQDAKEGKLCLEPLWNVYLSLNFKLKIEHCLLFGHHAGCKAAEGAADGDEGPPRDFHGPWAQSVRLALGPSGFLIIVVFLHIKHVDRA